jgi:hypothetical protein
MIDIENVASFLVDDLIIDDIQNRNKLTQKPQDNNR